MKFSERYDYNETHFLNGKGVSVIGHLLIFGRNLKLRTVRN